MHFILWIIFGGLAGWIATMLVGADSQFGIIGNIVIGIVGAFLGGWIMDKAGIGGAPGVERPSNSLAGFMSALIGAVILLLILNLIF